MKQNFELRGHAREILKNNWGNAVLTVLIYYLISFAASMVFSKINKDFGSILSLFISAPLVYGIFLFFLTLVRNNNTDINLLFEGFKIYGKTLSLYLLMILYIFLWMLLFGLWL